MEQGKVLQLRKKIGWSQDEMAQALGIAQGHTISHWETGFRNPSGVSQRILELLDDLSTNELQIITKRLEKLGTRANTMTSKGGLRVRR